MPPIRTPLPDPRRTPRFAGIATFCRYPRLEDVLPENRPVDWVIYGVPFDGGTTYRPGARFGPRAIREESQYVKPYHVEHGFDVREVLSLADAGDAPVSPYSCRKNIALVSSFAAGIDGGIGEGPARRSLRGREGTSEPSVTKLLAVGGDHSIAYANIRATWERRGRPKQGLALLHFDSHLDTTDAVWGESWGHASPFIRAIEDGLIDPRRMLSVGIKGPLNAGSDLDFAKKHGVTLVTYRDWKQEGGKRIASFLSSLGDDEAYLTFDIDVIDPAYAPGTGTPSVGGLTSAEALALLRDLVGVNLVGADVVEVLPDRDPQGITALLAAHVIFEIICLDGARRSGTARAKRSTRR